MWMNTEKMESFARADVLLHDSRATGAYIADGSLYFRFADGFWILQSNSRNTCGETVRTGVSELCIAGFDAPCVCLFRHVALFRRRLLTRRVEIPLETLIQKLNSGKWELEFLDEYREYRGMLYNCLIWQKRRPYYTECELRIDCGEVQYLWNVLRPECTW